MKMRLLIVTEDKTFDYRQNKTGTVYDNHSWGEDPIGRIVDEQSYAAFRREYEAAVRNHQIETQSLYSSIVIGTPTVRTVGGAETRNSVWADEDILF